MLLGAAYAQNAVILPGDNPAIEDAGVSQTEGESGEASHFPLHIRIVAYPEEAERAERRAEDAAQRERDDLAAQQSMAESTEQIVVISLQKLILGAFGTSITAIGNFSLLYSLILNKRSTKAAIDAVEISRFNAWSVPGFPEAV